MDVLTIGEFSERSGLSAKRLRTYAAEGLLAPAAADPGSGYPFGNQRGWIEETVTNFLDWETPLDGTAREGLDRLDNPDRHTKAGDGYLITCGRVF